MKRALVLLVILVALAVQSIANAGSVTLHPSGFGEHSYAAWNGDQGLPDSTGNKDQALYFQKMTATTTFAAGVAVFKGFAGLDTSAVNDLQFWWRTDGHCGAGAPRFNVRIQPPMTTDPALRQTIFVGCQGMASGATATDDHGLTWQQRTFVGTLPPGTVVSLAIVFDEGNDVGQGFVYLDNIRAGGHTWTSASDNGNNDAVTTDEMEQILTEPVSVAFTQ